MTTKAYPAIGQFRHGLTVYLNSPSDSRCQQAIPLLHKAVECVLKEKLQQLLEQPTEDWQINLTHYLVGEEESGTLPVACHELRERSLELQSGDAPSAEDEPLVHKVLALLLDHLESIFKNDLEKQVPAELLRAAQKRIYTRAERTESPSNGWPAGRQKTGPTASLQSTKAPFRARTAAMTSISC